MGLKYSAEGERNLLLLSSAFQQSQRLLFCRCPSRFTIDLDGDLEKLLSCEIQIGLLLLIILVPSPVEVDTGVEQSSCRLRVFRGIVKTRFEVILHGVLQ